VVPLLLHGPVGAEILRLEDGLNDTSIYRAAYWHTTAHSSLDPLGKVVFLADKLDPQKLAAYPYQAELMELALENLDLAILEFLTREAVSLMSRGQMVHPIVVETRNYLLESLQPTK
jgi:predicted HD superfamily hydrolase involved in NAD metabolism